MRIIAFVIGAALWFVQSAAASESYRLDEPITDARVYAVTSRVDVEGRLETLDASNKTRTLKLEANGSLGYRERRLSGTGRDAQALRTLRFYDEADARVTVESNVTSMRLPDDRRLIVAQGERDGATVYSPSGPLTFRDVELLRTPADSLALLALLPDEPVVVGEKWRPETWALQMLTGTDAVLKSALTCELESVADGTARVRFAGELEGANQAAQTEIELSGRYDYDLKRGYIKRLELKQREKASAGPVAPALEVTAKVVLERTLSDDAGPLSASVASRIPLDPDPSLMLLRFDAPGGVRFHHDRGWHLFHQTGEVAILRLIDEGSFVAQLNVTRIPDAEPGRHTSEVKFQQDIRESLGGKLSRIEKAEQLETEDGRFLYRVTATGEVLGAAEDGKKAKQIPMTWTYYLCAAPSGRQVSLLFAVETELLEKLDERDLEIVSGLEFLDTRRPVEAKPNR